MDCKAFFFRFSGLAITIFFYVLFSLNSVFASQSPLQKLVDETLSGSVVPLEPGIYFGPIIINKPVVLDGGGDVTIDNRGKGTLITVKADGVTIKNLTLINSGRSHDTLDAAISLRSSRNKIIDNKISNTLFGIEMKESHDNEITGNDISSKKFDLGLKGDGIRLWASHRNMFRHNKIHDSRDMVVWYSNDNLIENNEGWNNRYSLHFMYSGANIVKNNYYHNNSVGIFLMYSHDSIFENNTIRSSIGGTGIGLGMKDSSNTTIKENKIIYCAKGLFFDQSPFNPDEYNLILGNSIKNNIKGVVFQSSLKNNVFKGNAFTDNLESVEVHGNGTAVGNIWEGNFWSDYEGFDIDRDGIGDYKYNKYVYLDKIWMSDPWMKFYYGTPIADLVNLLAKLAPLSQPRLLVTDKSPLFNDDPEIRLSAENMFFDIPEFDEDEDDDEGFY